MSKSASPPKFKNPWELEEAWAFWTKPMSFGRYLDNDPKSESFLPRFDMKLRTPIEAQALEEIDVFRSEWLIIIDDSEPARGPDSNSGALPELLAMATYAAVVTDSLSIREGFMLHKHVEDGARVALVVTVPRFKEAWDLFLTRRTDLPDAFSVESEQEREVPDAGPVNSLARRICDQPMFSESSDRLRPRSFAATLRVDTAITRDFIKGLGGRWLVVIDDHRPAQGPERLSSGHIKLLRAATFIMLEPDASIHQDLCLGAELGGRIVVVSTGVEQLDAWNAFLEQYTP